MNSNKLRWLLLGILGVVGALVYLPLAGKLGLYKDDWFLIYDAHTQGSRFFHTIYEIDRPARGYVMQFTYNLFGDHILNYHISAYIYRVLAAWSLFRALEMVWTRSARSNFLASILFLIYPGFLSQVNPVDYQAQILGLLLAISSIAFTVKSIQSIGLLNRIKWMVLAVVTGVLYPALVDYSIGLEVLRLALIVQLVLQENIFLPRQAIRRVFGFWLPFLTAPALFLFWRIFLFETERRATDLGAQIGQLFNSPLTGMWWLINWVQDSLRVVFLAWAVPLYNLAFNLRLRDLLSGLGIGVLAVLFVLVGYYGFRFSRSEVLKDIDEELDSDQRRQMLITGAVSAVFALLPVIIANRHADFGDYSRYTLASAAGVGIVLTALISSLASARLRVVCIASLVLMASFTHYGNAVKALQETENVRNFWWQVAWRAPNIKPGVTLIASYPVGVIQEDYFVWGPANLIYYPAKQDVIPIEIRLPAAVLTDDVILQIITGKGVETPLRRGNQLTRDFSNILVMTQADENSCVRIVNGDMPELSVLDQHRTMLIAFRSQLENVTTQGGQATLPLSIFGTEPPHDWCFYYEKSDLARQKGEWQEVARLGEEAQKLGLRPGDQIEWMPFLQAHAFLGDQKQVQGISTRMNTERFYQQQACATLKAMPGLGYPLSSEMQDYVDELFCK